MTPIAAALLLTVPAAEVPLFVEGEAPLAVALTSGILRERPSARLVSTASAAELRAALYTRDKDLELRLQEREGAAVLRSLGQTNERDAALRMAVLLVVDRLSFLAAAPPGSGPRAFTAPEPSPSTRWRLEAAVQGSAWTTPLDLRLGASLALLHHLGRWAIGGRLLYLGLCCSSEQDGLSTDARMVGGLLRAQLLLLERPFELHLSAEGGLGYERLSAQVVGVFAGATVPEASGRALGLGRLGVTAAWALTPEWGLSAGAGAQLGAPALSVRLPEPYAAGLRTHERGILAPFLELGVSRSWP